METPTGFMMPPGCSMSCEASARERRNTGGLRSDLGRTQDACAHRREPCRAALRLLLPGGYSGPPLTLYRGTTNHERRRRLYGLSWTTDAAIARRFAEHWAKAVPGAYFEGLVLQTMAEAEAILLVRQPQDYYDEAEVVVDPYRLSPSYSLKLPR
jgi:hypothetical protein